MDVSVTTGRVEVLGEQTTLIMQAGEQHLFENPTTTPRRNGVLVAFDSRRLSLSFGGAPERIVRDYPLVDSAHILMDGQPTDLSAIPLGTRIHFLGTKQTGITEIAAMGVEVTARIISVDSAHRHVAVLLSGDGRKLELTMEQIDAPAESLALKTLLRVRLSIDGKRVVSARLAPNSTSPDRKQHGTKKSG